MLNGFFSFRDRYRILHLTWFAFFLTFVAWFSFAPFATTIGKELHLTGIQLKTLAICNLALTIPARIIVGMILDRVGPRRTFAGLLAFAAVPCLTTALSHSFDQLVWSRLLMGIVGAGFVVGIRMIAEWFPPKSIGIAEGVYGGWGNFGAFGAEFALPLLAAATAFWSGGLANWRLAMVWIGLICALYGLVYLFLAQDTPTGQTYQRPRKNGAIEVTSRASFYAMLAWNAGLFAALGLLAWRLARPPIKFLTPAQMTLMWGVALGLFLLQSYRGYQVNQGLLAGKRTYAPDEQYEYRQVGLLNLAYVVSFGSELAVVSMLPAFFEHTFHLNHVTASLIAASYPFMNLVSRPSGGLLSDWLSRKWTLVVITAGIGISYLMAAAIDSHWSLLPATAVVLLAAMFAQAGCGATFAMAPLIKKEVTGQIAGSVGAYGNVGGVVYLTIFSLTNPNQLFVWMGTIALFCAALSALFLKEPRLSHAAKTEPVTDRLATAQFHPPG
jgi:NNP family nitrate/nitrite transporter-like MFS transporter